MNEETFDIVKIGEEHLRDYIFSMKIFVVFLDNRICGTDSQYELLKKGQMFPAQTV